MCTQFNRKKVKKRLAQVFCKIKDTFYKKSSGLTAASFPSTSPILDLMIQLVYQFSTLNKRKNHQHFQIDSNT